MKSAVFVSFVFLLFCSSCKQSVEAEQLYGRWDYIKVEDIYKNPPVVMTDDEVKAASPSISFSNKGELAIIWNGKTLSHGTFKMDGMMIRVKEILEGGAVREFPFLITDISDEKIVFQTMNQDATRVTAVKSK
jgi:hypothetical protein